MKFSYKFSNLLGTVYKKGNLLFSPDGNTVISPVGNKITLYDLKNNASSTLPVETRYNFTALDLSPNGCFLIAVDEVGKASYISLISRTILHTYHFKRPVIHVKFSPDGKHFAICKENLVFIYKAPGLSIGELNPFVLEKCIRGAYDETVWIDWTSDSRVLAVGSKDMITRLYGLRRMVNFGIHSLGSHRDCIVACFFEKNSLDVTTISRNGNVCVWECNLELKELILWTPQIEEVKKEEIPEQEDDVDVTHAEKIGDETEKPEKEESETETVEDGVTTLSYRRAARHYLLDLIKDRRDVTLSSAAYHKETHILVTGFSNGSFFLHEMPDVNLIHSLCISEQSITSIAINCSGDWVALGCSGLGQLVVWEWQSETYAMKQQGHFNNMNCLDYSSDGQYIATGGEDGKVKIWNTTSGFCFVTFHEHTSAVTGVQFSNNRKIVISSSLDGTIRAFDMTRYRNFKTFTSPRPVQFACVAIDPSAEFVAAGGHDVFEIYLWSMKIGRLLEILSGHEGPVVSLAFSPSLTNTTLASVSWDKTLKLWNTIETGSDHESVLLTAGGLYVTYRPDCKEIAVATLDGQISFFETKHANQTGFIEGRNDLGSGRSETDIITAKKNLEGKAFSSLCYTADGECILAGGQSKNVCIYNVKEGLLIKKFEITQNRSLDAVDDFISRRSMTEFGNLSLVEEREEGNVAIRLPGVRRGDMASRSFKPEVRVFSLHFSPTGTAWAAATTEGLLIYSLDQGLVFDPYFLDESITPESVRKTIKTKEWGKALMMATRLNEKPLIQEVIECIPPDDVELTSRSLPPLYAERVLRHVALVLETSRHLEFYLLWAQHLLTTHGPYLRQRGSQTAPLFISLQKSLGRKYDELSRLCDFNKYTTQFILQQAARKTTAAAQASQETNKDSDIGDDEEEEMLMSSSP